MLKFANGLLCATLLAGCAGSYAEPSSQKPAGQAGVPAELSVPSDKQPVDAAPAKPSSQMATMSMPPSSVTPADLNVLFWNDKQREDRFRKMEDWFPGFNVTKAPTTRTFEKGAAFAPEVQAKIAQFVADTNAAGIMVIKDGQLRHEAYGLDFDGEQRWTSFSVAKSFTSTLLGAALKDGFVESLDDSVVKYLPEMAGSAYEDVTVKQLATMTSGVKWNENYGDPNSDVAKMGEIVAADGEDAIVTQLKALPREAPAGEKFVYKTGETNLLGVLVERATGMNLAAYSKSKIVDPAGFEAPMFWMIEPSGRNIGGCCLSITLGDYARMGQFVLEGGKGIVPEGWFEEAGSAQVSFGSNGSGYGYQWWVYGGGAYGAQGIFGQSITLVPEANLVVAVVSNWPRATSNENRQRWQGLVGAIAAAE